MTESEWQERYQITSIKGRIWTRIMIRKRASEMLRSLMPGETPIARRTAVELVLDDPAFMRSRTGMVPARVIADSAIEAMLRMMQRKAAS
jgi:hypothetical protein